MAPEQFNHTQSPGPSHQPTMRIKADVSKVLIILVVLFVLSQLGLGLWQQSGNNKLQNQILSLQNQAQSSQAQQQDNKLAGGIQTNKFQAVFLTNSQVYFGHLTFVDKDNYKLTDVYYLTNGASPTLTKLGNEAHKPIDEMFIPKSTVSFWENLQDAQQFNGGLK